MSESAPLMGGPRVAKKGRIAAAVGMLSGSGLLVVLTAARPPARPELDASAVRLACVDNDDDARFMPRCPHFDNQSWCSRPDRTGPAFARFCRQACTGPEDYAMVCAWQAAARIDDVCAGTFVPELPTALNRPNRSDVPRIPLYACDEHAVCVACYADGSPTRAANCERVAAYYGGFGGFRYAPHRKGPTGASAAFEMLHDLDRVWCSHSAS